MGICFVLYGNHTDIVLSKNDKTNIQLRKGWFPVDFAPTREFRVQRNNVSFTSTMWVINSFHLVAGWARRLRIFGNSVC